MNKKFIFTYLDPHHVQTYLDNVDCSVVDAIMQLPSKTALYLACVGLESVLKEIDNA